MSRGNPRIGAPLSLDERERQQTEEAIERREQKLDDAAAMTDYQKAKAEKERAEILEALRDTRPSKRTPEPVLGVQVPEPVAVEPVVIVPDAQMADSRE